MTETKESPTENRQYPMLLAVNIYLLVGIVILLLSSLLEVSTFWRYLVGIIVEFILAGLALTAMRIEKLEIVPTGRLNPPRSRRFTLLAVAATPGLWITGVLLNIFTTVILGYTTPVTPSQFPTTVAEALVLMMATMVVAPLCEELMFRGYVQRAYERRSITIGVLVGGLIFALYHLRFQGLAAITPVALALAVIAWRTRSIVPTIALHAAYNAIATVILVATSFLPMQATGALTGMLVCLGLLLTPMSYAALFLLWRDTHPEPHPAQRQPRPWLRWAWIVPLVGLAAVYGYAAVTEVLIARFPEVIAGGSLDLDAPPAIWSEPAHWRYAIQNQLGDEIGDAVCRRTQQSEGYLLECKADHEGYDLTQRLPFLDTWVEFDPGWWPSGVPAPQTLLQAEPASWQLTAHWLGDDLGLQSYAASFESEQAKMLALTYTSGTAGDPTVSIQRPDDTTTVSLPGAEVLMPYEWAWRLSALPLELATGGNTPVIALDAPDQDRVRSSFVNVVGGEPVWTPAGTFVTWKVTVTWQNSEGQEQTQTAWYDAAAPHTLVRLDDGAVIYALHTIESASQIPETDT